MIEITAVQAAKRLGVSRERVGQMLRDGELRGRQLTGSDTWLVDLVSVQDRARVGMGRGRPWSNETVASVINALTYGVQADYNANRLIRQTDTDRLWRKVSQTVIITRFASRRVDAVSPYLSLTGESALKALGEELVGDSPVLHGYLHGIELEDLMDDAGLVADSSGDVAIYRFREVRDDWVSPGHAQRALVAVDCARAASTRVHSIGLRALDQMRERWLANST